MASYKYDWNKIRTEYVTGRMSYRQLAENNRVCFSTLEKRAKAEGWVSQRNEYCGNMVENVIQKISETKADDLFKEIEAVDKISLAIQKAVGDKDFLFNYRNRDGTISVLKCINTRTLNDVLDAISIIVDLKTRFAGKLGEKDRQQLELEKERFEHQKNMDLARLELSKVKLDMIDDVEEYGVVLLPRRLSNE